MATKEGEFEVTYADPDDFSTENEGNEAIISSAGKVEEEDHHQERTSRAPAPVLVTSLAEPAARSGSNRGGAVKVKTVLSYYPLQGSGEAPVFSEKKTFLDACPPELVEVLTARGGPPAPGQEGTATPAPAYNSAVLRAGGAVPPPNGVYGRSIFQVPNSHNRVVAEAEHQPFAPEACICCQPCVGDQQRARTYARVYENRLETNYPWAPWCCFTPEYCIVDNVRVYYFDKGPSQAYCGRNAELDCCAAVCGQPVVFVQVPRCCCNLIDLRSCCGEVVYAAPCTCCDLRWPWICIGRPCYQQWACPLMRSVKNGRQFLEKYKGAVDDYAKVRPIQRHTEFHRVSEKPCDCDKVTQLDGYPIDNALYEWGQKLAAIPGAIPHPFVMDRV